MAWALAVAGTVAVGVVLRLAVAGRVGIWTAMGALMGLAGLAAVVSGEPHLSPRVSAGLAAAAGAGSGVALFAATRAFVAIARRWPPFARHTDQIYLLRGDLPVVAALLLGAGVVAVGEELFWRGLVQGELTEEVGRNVAALSVWVAYLAANVASGSLVLAAGGLVAGAAWGGLAWWTGGVLASILCHAIWTGLMIVLPPPTDTAKGAAA